MEKQKKDELYEEVIKFLESKGLVDKSNIRKFLCFSYYKMKAETKKK
jgi:hypothetical protein